MQPEVDVPFMNKLHYLIEQLPRLLIGVRSKKINTSEYESDILIYVLKNSDNFQRN